MNKSTIEFGVKKEKGVITKVGKSFLYTPPTTDFKGGSVKWYEDKLKGGEMSEENNFSMD